MSTLQPMIYVHERVRWQYKRHVHQLGEDEPPTAGQLDELGANGWELTGIITDSGRRSG